MKGHISIFSRGKMVKAHGGKRSGSGRKAKKAGTPPGPGVKTANFSTRITPETRSAIEAEAKEAGRSVSRMAEILMSEALDSRRLNERNGPTRAISYMLGELAEIVAPKQLVTDNFTPEWRSDPFLFEALKLGFVKLMDAIRPAGEILSPEQREPQFKGTNLWGPLGSVEERAQYAATIMLHNLIAARYPQKMMQYSPLGLNSKVLANAPYDLHRAWRGLNEGKTE